MYVVDVLIDIIEEQLEVWKRGRRQCGGHPIDTILMGT